jgi:tyrosyl-tRNA synthetase
MTHGEAAANDAAAASSRLFSANTAADVLLDDPNLPTAVVSRAELDAGMTIAELFVAAGLTSSRGEARRTAQQGGLSIGDQRVENVDEPVLAADKPLLLRFGKKKFKRVIFE